ncbi:MAG: phage holin family protein, partial [Ottowia sp.]|nr:phage holin family protein [Ottowia sp.]
MAKDPSSSGGAESRVRGWVANILELAEVRLELLTIEARVGVQRLVLVCVYGVLGAMLAAFGVIFLALLITVWVWATHPLLALGVFTTLFLGGGVMLMFLTPAQLSGLVQLCGVTRGELRPD